MLVIYLNRLVKRYDSSNTSVPMVRTLERKNGQRTVQEPTPNLILPHRFTHRRANRPGRYSYCSRE